MLHELYVLSSCIVLWWRQFRTDMIIDLAGALPSVRFPMGMSGGQVAGCSQNTSILPIPVSISRAKLSTSGASSISFYKSPAISCSMSGRTSLFTIFLTTSKHALHFPHTSLVGSTIVSMTYSINVQPHDDSYVKIAEEALDAISELLIPGAFLVDIIPILKYVPEWFPGAKFQSKAARMRKCAAIMRNTTFAATEKLMVFITFSRFLLDETYTFPGQRWLWSLVRLGGTTKRDSIFGHP